MLYYDCSNYHFEIEQKYGDKKYGKSKEHRTNPIIQMGLFMDWDGIPLAFSTFTGNANEQTSLKPLGKKVLGEFGCQKSFTAAMPGLLLRISDASITWANESLSLRSPSKNFLPKITHGH